MAFNLSQYALLPVAIGFFMIFAGKKERLKHYGMMLMGLGLVFYGMGIMSDAMSPLRNNEPFLELLKRMEKPALGNPDKGPKETKRGRQTRRSGGHPGSRYTGISEPHPATFTD